MDRIFCTLLFTFVASARLNFLVNGKVINILHAKRLKLQRDIRKDQEQQHIGGNLRKKIIITRLAVDRVKP